MNCQEALELLYDIIDKEASEIDVKEVEQHLKKCRHCFEAYRLEESLQALIKEKLTTTSVTPCLTHLQQHIKGKLDAIDSGEPPAKKKTRFFDLSTRAIVAAASLVVFIGAAVIVDNLLTHQSELVPLERAHWAVETGESNLSVDADCGSVISFAEQRFDYSPYQSVREFSLTGGKVENIFGVDMHHLVYSNGQAVVSVFIAPSDKFEMPSEVLEGEVVHGGITFFDHNCRGCRVVFHRAGEAVIITATNDRSVDLLEFVPGIAAL